MCQMYRGGYMANGSKGWFQHCSYCIYDCISPHLHWTWVYVSNVHRWLEQMVAGQVWKISATYQQMDWWVNAVTTELSAFWSKFTRSLYLQHCACFKLKFNTASLHSAALFLSPPLQCHAFTAPLTSNHPALHHIQRSISVCFFVLSCHQL